MTTKQLTPSARGRRGALAFIAKHGIGAARERAAHASRSLRASFEHGHGCSLCPKVTIPDDLSPEERTARADALWHLHWIRLRAVAASRRAHPTD